MVFQQADAKASKAKATTAPAAGVSPWKMAGRAGLGRGGW
jgi:hypothetical protein